MLPEGLSSSSDRSARIAYGHRNRPRGEALSLSEAAALIDALQRELGRVIIGLRTFIAEILVAFLAGGHSLLCGVRGLAKTLLIETNSLSNCAVVRMVITNLSTRAR